MIGGEYFLLKLAIIPARSGSKRIPNKNIIEFFGYPMIYYALDAVSKSGMFDEVHVSTDSSEIATICSKLGYRTRFLRPPELSDDSVGLSAVIKWVLESFEREGERYSEICCIMPCAPLLKYSDIKEAYLHYWFDKDYPLLCFAKLPVPSSWAFYKSEGYMCPVHHSNLKVRSQDLSKEFYECGPFSWWRRNHFNSSQVDLSFVNYFPMPAIRAVDIDEPEDLELAKALYTHLHTSSA